MKRRGIIAAIAAAAVAASMCGCMDNGKIMTIDGQEINNGVYLFYQQSAYVDAQGIIREASSSESSESESSKIKYFSTSVEGKSTAQWVKDETMRLVKEYVAIQKLCDEKGISLDQIEKDEIAENVRSTWDDTNNYIQYFFKVDTMGKYYESFGIGRESYSLVKTSNALRKKLFLKLYDKDGETPVSDDDFIKFVKENYASVELLKLDYKDYKGNALTSDSDKKAVDEQAQKYADRLSGGESFIDVKYDYDLKAEQDGSREDIEDYYDKNPVEGKTKEEYVAEEIAKLTVDKADDLEDIIKYYKKGDKSADEKVLEFVFSAKDDGKAALLKTDDCVYVIARTDVSEREKWLEENHTSLLQQIKNDEFDEYLDEYAEKLSVDANSYLIDAKYKPEKLENKQIF